MDSCEQPIERPGAYEEQKKILFRQEEKSYSKKSINWPNGKDIVDVIAGQPGPKSDVKLFRETQNNFDENQKFTGDKAYEGEASIRTPKKKPKKRELTAEQKKKNQELAVERVIVEHVIRLVKIFRVAQERFRLNTRKYEQIIGIICGLVRLRIGALILPI